MVLRKYKQTKYWIDNKELYLKETINKIIRKIIQPKLLIIINGIEHTEKYVFIRYGRKESLDLKFICVLSDIEEQLKNIFNRKFKFIFEGGK